MNYTNAAIIIVTPTMHTLLLKISYNSKKWTSPGGMIDEGETPLDAAKREFEEEVGDKINLNIATDIIKFNSDRTIIYVVYTPQRINVNLSDEHDDYVFAQIDMLEDMELTAYANKSFAEAKNLGIIL